MSGGADAENIWDRKLPVGIGGFSSRYWKPLI